MRRDAANIRRLHFDIVPMRSPHEDGSPVSRLSPLHHSNRGSPPPGGQRGLAGRGSSGAAQGQRSGSGSYGSIGGKDESSGVTGSIVRSASSGSTIYAVTT